MSATGEIVVVDDSFLILDRIRERLTAEGYHVRTTTGHASAMKLVQHADLAIIDFHMPGVDGAEMLSSLRDTHPTSPCLYYLYTSDRGRVGAIAKGIRKTTSRVGGRLEPLGHVELVLHQGSGELHTVTGVELTRLRAAGGESDVIRSYYPARGADLYYFLDPYWLPTSEPTGTGHGSPWRYDQEVPLLWAGPGVRPGVRAEPATVADLAPTLSRLLGIPTPGGAQGRVLGEMLR